MKRGIAGVLCLTLLGVFPPATASGQPGPSDDAHTWPTPPVMQSVAAAVVSPPLEARPPIEIGDFASLDSDGADALHVKFADDTALDLVGDRLVGVAPEIDEALASADADVSALFDRPEAELDAERGDLEVVLGAPAVDLAVWYRVEVADPDDLVGLLGVLNAHSSVEAALPEPHVAPATLAFPAQTSPDHEAEQIYRLPAPVGIDALHAQTVAGGSGTATTLFDIEYSWNTDHEDLGDAVGAELANGTPVDPFANPDHGTGVLGIMAAEDNGFGVTGIVPDAPLRLVNVHTDEGQALTNALTLATANAAPGDVILVEQQLCPVALVGSSCPTGWLPIEWFPSYYDAIVAAVGAGIHVVQPAGNGGRDVDGELVFPDSGSILVGAGNASGCTVQGAAPPRGRLGFSNYGSRIDVQGHGACVWTTGVEGLGAVSDADTSYTGFFNGTSAASAIVAGAVVSLASISETAGDPLAPNELRALLRATGVAQDTSVDPFLIGPQPDLRSAVTSYLADPHPAPANDDFHAPSAVGALPAGISQSADGASIQVGEPVATCGSVDRSLWFRFDPAVHQRLAVDVAGSDGAPSVAVWWQSDPDVLTQLACAPADSTGPVVAVDVRAGETYLIQVGDVGGQVDVAFRSPGACDVDGDGWGDVVVGVPGEAVGGDDAAGAVAVVFGHGPDGADRGLQRSAASSGVAGAAEADDRFGEQVACGDLDGDGYDDVVVGIPGEDRKGQEDSGAIHVLPGSATGLDTSRDRFVTQSTGGVPGSSEAGDRFGASLAVGDFDGDGYDDVAVGAPGEAHSGADDAGLVTILRGGATGLDTDGGVSIHQNSPGIPGGAEDDDGFGTGLAAGDVNADGYDDLVITMPDESLGGANRVGAATVVLGGGDGLDLETARWLAPTQSGIASPGDGGRRFGRSVAVGDVDGDGFDDVLIGSAGKRKGGVDIVMGAETGVVTTGRRLRVGRAGVPSQSNGAASFARSLAVVDTDGDGSGEVVVGSPNARGGASRSGAIFVVSLGAGGVTLRAAVLTQDTVGVADTSEADDDFGAALAGADLDGDGRVEIVVGVPGERVSGKSEAGAVVIIEGGADVDASRQVHSEVDGVGGRSETGDRFGAALD